MKKRLDERELLARSEAGKISFSIALILSIAVGALSIFKVLDFGSFGPTYLALWIVSPSFFGVIAYYYLLARKKAIKTNSILPLVVYLSWVFIIIGLSTSINEQYIIPAVAISLIFWGLFTLVSWHSHTFEYKCKKCGVEFPISTITDFVSLQFPPNKKFLKCPAGHWGWCTETINRKESK